MLITTNENPNPKFALIIIEQRAFAPNEEINATRQWQQFLAKVHSEMPRDVNIQKLAENVFLIPLENGLSNLVKILAIPTQVSQPYKVLFFEKEPNWITSNKVEGENQ